LSGFSGAYVHGDAFLTDLRITQLEMYGGEGLEQVDGKLTIENNPLLVDLETYGAHDIYLASNPVLEHALFVYAGGADAGSLRVVSNPSLRTIQDFGARSIDEVEIANNPLFSWPFLTLNSAYSISIHDNSSLPVCQIQALFDTIEAYSEVQARNDEDGVCN